MKNSVAVEINIAHRRNTHAKVTETPNTDEIIQPCVITPKRQSEAEARVKAKCNVTC